MLSLTTQEREFYSALGEGGILTLGLEERCPSDVERVWQTHLAQTKLKMGAAASRMQELLGRPCPAKVACTVFGFACAFACEVVCHCLRHWVLAHCCSLVST